VSAGQQLLAALAAANNGSAVPSSGGGGNGGSTVFSGGSGGGGGGSGAWSGGGGGLWPLPHSAASGSPGSKLPSAPSSARPEQHEPAFMSGRAVVVLGPVSLTSLRAPG
jgi:hypothetical protein